MPLSLLSPLSSQGHYYRGESSVATQKRERKSAKKWQARGEYFDGNKRGWLFVMADSVDAVEKEIAANS